VSKAEVDQGVYLIEGNETPEEIISLAYGLEEGGHRFYRDLSVQSTGGKTKSLFETLSEAEARHKEDLWREFEALTGGRMPRGTFEATIVAKTVEGGKTAHQLLEEYGDRIQDPREALQLALSLEIDALDLYLRMALKTESEEAKAIFHSLANEEKTHLRWVGELLRGELRS
jgi:rubrerythrin